MHGRLPNPRWSHFPCLSISAFTQRSQLLRLKLLVGFLVVDSKMLPVFPTLLIKFWIFTLAVMFYLFVLLIGRQRLLRREVFSEESWKKVYYLSNGNGSEMRWLAPLMR